jgi:hypothetical protein
LNAVFTSSPRYVVCACAELETKKFPRGGEVGGAETPAISDPTPEQSERHSRSEKKKGPRERVLVHISKK